MIKYVITDGGMVIIKKDITIQIARGDIRFDGYKRLVENPDSTEEDIGKIQGEYEDDEISISKKHESDDCIELEIFWNGRYYDIPAQMSARMLKMLMDMDGFEMRSAALMFKGLLANGNIPFKKAMEDLLALNFLFTSSGQIIVGLRGSLVLVRPCDICDNPVGFFTLKKHENLTQIDIMRWDLCKYSCVGCPYIFPEVYDLFSKWLKESDSDKTLSSLGCETLRSHILERWGIDLEVTDQTSAQNALLHVSRRLSLESEKEKRKFIVELPD